MINTTMVRETRHLWVGNLPENIREERLIDYFKRYGKVQSVRIFSKSISSTNCGTDNNGQPTTTSSTTNTTLPTSSTTAGTTTTLNGPNYTNGGGSFLCNNSVSATVAFIDIKSAAKAHSSENKIEERTLKTDYYEPHRHHSDDHHSSLNATTKLSSSNITTNNNSSTVNNYNHNNSNAVACSSSSSTSLSSSCSGGVGSTVLSSTSSSSSLTAAAAASSSSSTISAATLSNSGSSSNSNNLLSGTGTLSSTTTAINVPPTSSTAAIQQQQQQSSLGTVSSTTSASTSSSTSAIAAAASSSSSSNTATTTASSSSSTTTTSSSSSSSSPATPLSSNASLYGRHTPIRYNSTIVLESNSTNNNQSASSSAHHHHHHHSSSSSSSTTAASQLSSSLVNNTTTTTTIGAGAVGGTGSGGGHSNFPGVLSSPKDDHISMTTSSSLLNDREESSRQNNNTTATTTAICVRKISHRLTDSSIKESLFYEFKRYGKIIQTLVRGQGSDRHAIVVFNKPEEAEKALKDSKDKQFLGSRVEITPCDYSDIVGDCNNNRNNNNENIDNDYDVYHPRATRTLFVGNLDKEVSYGDLAKKFSQFGEIMEIDIKKQNQPYAFIRFNNISSVVKAMRRYDNEPMGGTKLKLGYGKSFSSCCIWIGDYKDSFSDVKGIEKYLNKYGQVNRVLPDCEQRSVLCFFETHEEAKKAVEDLRQKSINGRRVNVDFASRDYQTYFLEKRTPLNNNNNGAGGSLNNDNNTSNNSHRGRSGSWISSSSANSVDYDDQRTYDRSSRSTSSYHHHQLNSRSSSSSLLQVRSNSGNNGNNVNSGGNGGSSSYSSLRQRSQTPPPSPPSTDSTSFNSRHSLSQSSSLHGGGSNSRVSSKHDYHPSSRASYGRYSPLNDDEDDVDEESHHSSSSNHKRESSSSSSRYSRSHHLSDSFLPTDMASPKIRRDSSPYSSLKLDSDFPHRSSSLSNRNSSSNLANNNSNSDDIKSSHDDVGAGHGVSRRSNHSKLFHMSRRGIGVMAGDSPTPQHQSSSSSSSAQQQYRKSGLSSSSSSSTSSSNSRSPIGRESKSSSHYQDRTSVSPPPSPRLNHHHHHQYSYHDGDRPIGTSNTTTTTTSNINDGSNIGDHHHSHAHQWRRKSTDDSNHHTSGTGGGGGGGVGSVGGIGSDVLRLKSDSIIDINNSDVINNSSSSSSSTTSSSHREHGRDYRDRFRDSSNHRTNSLLTTSSSLGSYQNRSSDSYAKRRFNSSLEVDENSSDLPGHLERKKRLMACVEQSSSNSSLTNSSSTSLVNQSGSLLTSTVSSNSNLATSNDNKSTSSKNSTTNHVTNLSILNDVKLLHSSKNVSRDPIHTTAAASSSSSSTSSCSSTVAGSLLVDHHLHQASKRRLSNTANSVGIANNSGCGGGSSSSSIGTSGNPYTEGNFKDLKPILQYYLAEGNLNQHQTNAMLTLLNPEQSKATTLQLLNSSSNNKGSATIPSTAASTTNISTTVTSSSAASTVSSKSGASGGGGPSVGNICGFSSTSSNSGSSVVGQTPALTTATTASTTATAATSLATMNNVNSLNSTATTIASLATSSTKTKTKDMCPTITLRTIDVCTSSVNQSLMDPRISGHNYSGGSGGGVGGSGSSSSKSIYSSRISCDNDLKNPKLSETSSSSSSSNHHHHHHHHSKHQSCEYGPSSPWNLPLPEFAKAQQLKTNTTATILTGDNATKSHLSSLSLSLSTAINSNIVIQNSSTTAMISNPLSAALSSLSNTTGSNNLTHIPSLTESSVRNLTGSSPKNANIMSPLGNLSPVPKHRLSRDRMSTETNSFDFKRSADRIDLDDVSDTDMGGNFLNDDKLKPLDEKHNAWSGTSCTTPTLKSERTPTIDYSKYNIKKKSQSNTNTNGSTSLNNNSSNENDSTDLKNILSSSSVFDQDSKRLEHLNEKYEPKDVSTLDLDSIGSSTSAHKISLSSRTKFSSSIPSSLVLPTDKTSSLLVNSLDTLPKTTTTSTTPLNTPLSSSSSSSTANTAFHYNHHPPYHHHTHHHHHHSISSSTNNLIPTTTSSSSSVSSSSNMSRKFSTESSLSASNSNNATNRTNQIKKDYSITPTTPGSAPVRSTATMFPQFSRSSSIPTSSNTAPNTPTTLVNNNSNSRTSSSSFNRKDSSGGVQSSNSCYPPQNTSNSGGNQLPRQASETKQYKLDLMNKSSSSASNVSKTIQSSASSSCFSSSSSNKSGGGGDHQNLTMKKDQNVAVNKSTVQDQQQQQHGHLSNKNKHEISSTNNQSSTKNEFNRKEVERKNSSTGSDHSVSNNNNCASTQDVMKDHNSSFGGGNSGKSKTEPSTSKHSSKESLKYDDNNPGIGNNNNNNNNYTNNREPTSRKASMEKQNSGGSREQQKSSSNETSKTMDKEKKIDSSNTNNNNNNNISKKGEVSNQVTKEKEREKMKKKSKEKEKEYSNNNNNKNNTDKDGGSNNKDREQRRGGGGGEEKEKNKDKDKEQQCSKRKCKTIENSDKSNKNSSRNKSKGKSKNSDREKKKDKYKDKNKENNKNSHLHDYDDEPIYFSMYDKVKARSMANQIKQTPKPSSMDSTKLKNQSTNQSIKHENQKEDEKSSQDSEEDSDDSSYDRENFKSDSKYSNKKPSKRPSPSSSSNGDDEDDDEEEDDDDDEEAEDSEVDPKDLSKYSNSKKSKKLFIHDDDSCSTIERTSHYHGRGLDDDYCGNSKRDKFSNRRDGFSEFLNDDDSSGTSNMISSISSSRSTNKNMGKSKKNSSSSSGDRYPSLSIPSDEDDSSMNYIDLSKSTKKSKKEKDRYLATSGTEKSAREYSSKNCGDRKMKNDKSPNSIDIQAIAKTLLQANKNFSLKDDDEDDEEDDSITRAWKMANREKKKKKKSKSSKDKLKHFPFKGDECFEPYLQPAKLNPEIFYNMYDDSSDDEDSLKKAAREEAAAREVDSKLKFRDDDQDRYKNNRRRKYSGRDRFPSSSNKGKIKRKSYENSRIKMDDEDSSSNVSELLNDKRKKKSIKNKDKLGKDSLSNDDCDKIDDHSLADEKHRIEMASDMYMLLSPNSKYYRQKSHTLDYRPGSPSPPPRTPEISSPLSSPSYSDNIITSQVDDNSYPDKTIDEELINESKTILRHFNENDSSSDSCLSELEGGHHDLVTGDSNDFNALISGQASLGNLVTIHQNDNDESSKSVSPFEQKFHLQRNYEDEAIIHLQKEIETDLIQGQSVGHFPGFETITTNITTENDKPMIQQIPAEFLSSPESSSACKIVDNQTATLIMAKLEPNNAIILDNGDEIIGQPFNNESMIVEDANEQQPSSSMTTTIDVAETRIEDDDVECQRKKEDDLAVAALLQDMNDPCARITGPSVETDQIETGSGLHTLQFIITPVVESDQPVMIDQEEIMETPEKAEVVARVIMVDDQELKAAVQEIETSGQDILEKDEAKVSTVDSTPPIAVVMFNNDNNQCDHELIVDDNVLEKSFQGSIDLAKEQGNQIIISTTDPNSTMTTESLQLIANKILSPKNTNAMIIEDRRHSHDQPPFMFEIVQVDDVHQQLQSDCTQMELVPETDQTLNVEEINETLLEENPSTQLNMPILEVINDQDSSGETLATFCMSQGSENFDAELFSKTTVVTMQLQPDDNKMVVDNSDNNKTIEQQKVITDVTENESAEATKMDEQQEQEQNSAPNDINNEDAAVIINNNIQKRSIEEIEPDSTNECASKPKRGRRTKNRKNSDSLMHSPRSESQQPPQDTSVSLSNSLTINTNLPTATNVALLSPTSQSSVASDVSPGSQTKQPRGKQQQQGAGAGSGGYYYSIRRSVRTAAVAASAVNSTTLEDLDDTDYSMDEQPTIFKDEQHDDDNKKKQPKRGRKKKNSPNVESQANKANENNDHKKTLLSATNTVATSTTSAMAGATNISIGTSANRPKSPRAYDVFEFTDEEDEGPLTLDHIKTPHFMSSSNVLDENKHLFEKRHLNDNGATNTTMAVDVSAVAKQQQPEASVGSTVSSTSAEMNATLSPTTIPGLVAPTAVATSSNLGVCPKEYVSEVNQSGKLVIRLQDSGNNDGKTKEDVKFVEESASSSTAAAINDNSILKGVRKSARLMSAQGAKSTSDEIMDEQSAAMKNVAAANNQNQNKVEGEKQGNATCKRVTRSNRKSDDGVQPTNGNNGGQDSEEEQDDSKTRNYRVTRSRGSNVQEDPTSKKTESSSSSDDVTVAKSTNEENNEIIMKNVDDGCQSTTATLPTTTMAESEQPISTVINVPITSSTDTLSSEPKKSESLSVIQSTGNVEKIANIAHTVVATATTPTLSTTVTTTTTVPTVPITPEVPSANVAVITSTPMTMITTPPTIKSPSIIDHHQNMKFVPSFSERLHNSPTTCALKLKTGKGLIYESIMSGEKIPSIDLNATSAATAPTTTTTATSAPSLVTMSPVITGTNVNVHTTVHIKPKFQHPVGQQATEILRPISKSPNIVANSGPNVINDPVKTISPSVSSVTPPSMAESIKNLNINCNNGNQPPPTPNTSAVPLNPTSKPLLHNKSVLQVAGVNAQPLSNPPELNLSYPGNLLNTTASSHPNMSSADVFLQHQQEYLNSLQKQQQSQPMSFINPQQMASLAQGRPPQPPVSGANQIINPSMIPMANYELDNICNQIHLWNAYPNAPGMRPQQMPMPQRFMYNAAANFPCPPPPPGLTPEQIEQAQAAALQLQQQQQKSHLASKSQKDEMHRAPSSFNEDIKLHPESSFPIDMASLNASRNYPGIRHFGPILALPPERFPLANEAVYLQYGLNGQNRNLSAHPLNYGQDLSKQQPPLEPKRPPSKPFPSPSHSPAYRKDLAGNVSSAESNVETLRNPISNQFMTNKDPHSQQPSAATTLNNNDPPLNMSTFQRVPSPNLPQPLSRPSSECSVFEQSKRVTPPDYISSVSPAAAAASLPPPPTSNYGPTTTPSQQEGILQRHPQLWSGLLAMKGDQTAVQMHYICGNKTLAAQALSFHQDNSFASLRITQRMRIDSCHLNQVEKKIQSKDDFCILIALPCGRDSVDVLQQSNNLYKYFITYLQSKHAAGIVNDSAYGYVMHIFPPGEYSDRYLVSTAPNLLSFGISHLMVVITTSSNSL